MLGALVYDVREQTIHKEFTDEEMDAVDAFHDDAERFWRDLMATDPPLDPDQIVAGLRRLRDACTGPLAQFHRKLDRGVERAEQFARQRQED
jgi:hypothetical protein